MNLTRWQRLTPTAATPILEQRIDDRIVNSPSVLRVSKENNKKVSRECHSRRSKTSSGTTCKRKSRNVAPLNEPSHKIMVIFVLRIHSSNAHAQPSNAAGCLIFGRTLRLLPYFMCANSEGSGETARIHRLA